MTNQSAFPVKNESRTITGVSPAGEEHLLIEIDNVEEHDQQTADYNLYVRVTVHNDKLKDTFIFDSKDFKVVANYLQTNEETMELLQKYMQLLQSNTTLNNFITEIANQFYGSGLGYTNIRLS